MCSPIGSPSRCSQRAIDVVTAHVAEGGDDSGNAIHALHERDLALLLVANGMGHDAQAQITAAVPHLVSHPDRASVMLAHRCDEQRVELVGRRALDLAHLVRRQEARHGGTFLCAAIRHVRVEPAQPPGLENPVLAGLARDHQHRELAQMRVAGAFGADLRELDTLRVVRRHVAKIGLVGILVAAHPRQLVADAAEQRDGAEHRKHGNRAGDPGIGEAHVSCRRVARHPAQSGEQGIHHGGRAVDEQADPVGLLQREQRLPERKQRRQHEPFHGRGEHRPGQREQQDRQRPQIGGPAPERAEEDQRPGKIRPLVEGDAGEDRAPRRLGADRPVARRNGRDRHPVDRRIAANPGGEELADDGREAATDQAERGSGDPA
ncbi:hypothetical protein ACVWY3_001692 [Bradyrhizobium sp. USDA 4486]